MENNYLVLLARDKLDRSKFRSSQRLSKKLKRKAQQANEKDKDKLRRDAVNLLSERLFVANPKNDGKQTPFRGHPVFVAQHATATCCRECLWKWYKIPKNKPIHKEDQLFIIGVIMNWITTQLS